MRIELDNQITTGEIASLFSGDEYSANFPHDGSITHICTDTRECQCGDLFIALKGRNADGNNFVADAISKGCICIADNSEISQIKVKNTIAATLSLAAFYKLKFKNLKSCIAITGSVGKSSTKEFLLRILSAESNVHANNGNFNNALGVSHTVFSMSNENEYLICEVGMNHAGEISMISKSINPNISIITNVGTAHIGNLGSRKAISNAKLEITDGMKDGILLIPYNEPLLASSKKHMTVGYNREPSLSDFMLYKDSSHTYAFKHPNGIIYDLSIPISEDHLLIDVSFALSASLLLRTSEEGLRKGLLAISHNDLRQEFITMNGYTVFNDSYNASYESVIADLKHLKKSFPDKPIGAILGDIAELGESSEEIHTKIGIAAAELKISSLYLIGRFSRKIAKGAIVTGFDESRIFVNEDPSNFDLTVAQLTKNHLFEEVILLKASHSSRIYEIADILKKRKEDHDDR